jgi:histone H3/H4
MDNLTVNAIKRLARRGGVTRMSKLIVAPVRESMQLFLMMLIKCSIIYMEQDKKTTIRLPHLIYLRRGLVWVYRLFCLVINLRSLFLMIPLST